jgi:hypothetical protein
MKRDFHLVRAILLHFEDKPHEQIDEAIAVGNYSALEIGYHLILMYEAGLIRGEALTSTSGRIIRVLPASLTWKGHEFLDMARDNTLWKKAMGQGTRKTSSLSFDVLKALLIHYIEKKIGVTVA